MRSNQILKADIIDIIFENRNKSYGAYALRKAYNNRLYKALALSFLFVSICLSASLFTKKTVVEFSDGFVTEFGHIQPDKPNKPAPKQKRVLPKHAPDFVANINISKLESKVNKLAKNLDSIEMLPPAVPGPRSTPAGPWVKPVEGPTPPAMLTSIDKNIPVTDVDVMPAFPGGINALMEYLKQNLREPEDLQPLAEGQEVSVQVKFIVGYDGKLKSFELVQDAGEVFNKEVIRVLKKMPDWIPGKARGENVSVWYTVPVKFISGE